MDGQQILMSYAGGNPGAANFLVQLLGPEYNVSDVRVVEQKLKECKTIRGTNLYVLWSDLCDKDAEKVVKLCKNCPNDILEDACNRQDYSGRELVEEYLK